MSISQFARCLLCAIVLITSSSEPLRTVLHFETHQEQQSVELPDGSRLHLNAHTKLLAAFTALSRHIDLLQGEARFHVEKDRKRPFVVDTPHARVSALGTTFNVQVAARDTDVTLLEGRISVSKLVAHEAATSGRLELRAGQNVRIQSNGEMAFGRGRTAHAANAWPRQVMAFRHSKLSEVVAAVNRHRDNLLIIGDVRLNDMEVNGSLNVFESEPFWDSLEKAEHIRVERREDGSMVLVPARKMLD